MEIAAEMRNDTNLKLEFHLKKTTNGLTYKLLIRTNKLLTNNR
jgi:hypothetical protein